MRKLRILVDMDGVIVDFERGVFDQFVEENGYDSAIPLNERHHFHVKCDYPTKLQPRVEKIYTANGFFAGLPMIDGALAGLLKLSQENDVFICTKPLTTNATCASDKYSWVADKIGRNWVQRVIMTADKTLVHGDYLIDDRPVVEGDFERTWRHVLYSQPYNRKFGRGMTWKDYNRSQVPFEVFVRPLDGTAPC